MSEILKTKDQLNSSNFKLWKQQLYLLLRRFNLTDYISSVKIEKVDGSTLKEEEKQNLILVDDTINNYYKKGTKGEVLKNDSKVKEIILNSINEELASSIDFISGTLYEIYRMIVDLHLSDEKDRIEEIKDSLNHSKYDPENVSSLPIFISNKNLKFKELENLGEKLEFKEKFVYLFNAMPEELTLKTNLIDLQRDWEDTTKRLIERVQLLKRLKEKKEKTENIVSNLNNPDIQSNYTNKNYKNNIKCWSCGEKGHYQSECNNRRNFNKNNNNNNNKNNYKYNKNKFNNNRNNNKNYNNNKYYKNNIKNDKIYDGRRHALPKQHSK